MCTEATAEDILMPVFGLHGATPITRGDNRVSESNGEKKYMKNRFAGSLIGAALLLSILAMPLLFRLFPFPSLEDAQHLKGEVRVQFHRTVGRGGGGQLAKIFIITERESVEIDCGYPMDRRPCPYFNRLDGTFGEVWYHRVFGVVQWKLVNSKTGEQFNIGIEDVRRFYEGAYSSERQINILVFCIALLMLGALLYDRNSSYSMEKFFNSNDLRSIVPS